MENLRLMSIYKEDKSLIIPGELLGTMSYDHGNNLKVNLCVRTFETRTDNSTSKLICILKHKMLNINFCEGLEFRASRYALKGTVRCQPQLNWNWLDWNGTSNTYWEVLWLLLCLYLTKKKILQKIHIIIGKYKKTPIFCVCFQLLCWNKKKKTL